MARDPLRTSDHAGDSVAVAAWTLVSRVTGFGRVVVIAAVLGPTYLGSLFLAIDLLPALVLQLIGRPLVGSLLISSLTPTIDRGDRRAANDLAGGFLGVSLLGLAAVALVSVAAAPLVLGLLTLGVADRDVASDQVATGWLLMALTMPQIPLYALATIGAGVMNAHGRFRLAAFAPVAENVGVIATMAAVALAYGTGGGLASVPTGEVLLLGLGSTAAVGLHASLMLWGASRLGTSLRPRPGWRIPAVRALLRRTAASASQSAVLAFRLFAMLAVSNTVPGGVVAYRLALNFLYLPVQIGAQPVSLTMLPTLSRLHEARDLQAFRDECTRGLALVLFLTVPAAAAYAILADPLADTLSLGAMSGTAGPTLVAACLAGIALAVIGESGFQLFTNASYARHDARSPLVAAVAGTVVFLPCLGVALLLDGTNTLLAVGLAHSAGMACSAAWLHRTLDAGLPTARGSALPSVLRTLLASAVMAGPAYVVSWATIELVDGSLGPPLAVAAAAAVGIATFVAVQRMARSEELVFFLSGVRRVSRPG